jgi:hypothetical protein
MEEGASLKPLLFLGSKEYREIRILLGKDINVVFPIGVRLSPLLHDVCAQE